MGKMDTKPEDYWCDDEKKKETSMTYTFENDEYSYYATALVFGTRGPKLRTFSPYSMEVFRKNKDLTYGEVEGLNTDSKLEINRHLRLDPKRIILTGHTNMASQVNNSVTYQDTQFNVKMADSLFSDSEFDYFAHNWDATVQNKIRTLGILIKSLQERVIKDIPLLINEFPNITKTLLAHPEFWLNKNEINELYK
jgi:hypothetical protein